MGSNSHPRIFAATPEVIARAAQLLREGRLVAVPTETVYGLAARADADDAVAAIYRAKGRPAFNPLIVHVPGIAIAQTLAEFDSRAHALANRFWPGPLTLVLPRRASAPLADAVTAGLPTVALRCPAHPVMQQLLAAVALPLAAPSANRSAAISPTAAGHVAQSLGDAVDLILDGGACERGLESTIVALRPGGGWEILRSGPIGRSELVAVLGASGEDRREPGMIEAPGQMSRHYSPGKPMRLGIEHADADEFHIGFGAVAGDITLSARGDPREAARRLYQCLHAAAAAEQRRIAVAPVPEQGLGIAINDRLRRAAS